MADLAHARLDGRIVAVASISSVGEWTDVTLADLASITGVPVPESGAKIVAVEVWETSGSAPAYLLLRANDGEAASGAAALPIPSGGARGISCNLSTPITVMSIYGSANIAVFLV